MSSVQGLGDREMHHHLIHRGALPVRDMIEKTRRHISKISLSRDSNWLRLCTIELNLFPFMGIA